VVDDVSARAVTCAAIALALVASSTAAIAATPKLRVGSKRFTESYILAEIAAEVARRTGAETSHAEGLGGTAIVYRALEEGSIDVYPEYTGTIVEAILHGGAADLASIRAALAPKGIGVSEPLGFENRYALASSSAAAKRDGLARVSDVAWHQALRIGLSHEFLGRSDGWIGLARAYGIDASRARGLDHGLAYQAIEGGDLDVTDVYSTDAKIARYGLVVLDDDKRFFPSYAAVWLYRKDLSARAPEALAAVLALAGAIDAPQMIAMNAAAEIDGKTFAAAARGFVDARLGAAPSDGAAGSGAHASSERRSFASGLVDVVRTEGPRHLLLVVIALVASTLVGVPLGVVASRRRRLGQALLAATGVVQTIPSLALLCFFIPLFGTGVAPALAALFLYGLLPIARSTLAGLDAIPPSLAESAEALGLSPWAALVKVRLPLAAGTLLSGVRTSAVLCVGTATLAAFVGAGGFGAPISVGLNLNDTNVILEGAIPAAGLALIVEGLFSLLERVVVPRGLRVKPAPD
jgi:osmoprotectant transport system permease protein